LEVQSLGTIVALGGGSFANGEMRSVAEEIIRYSGKSRPKVLFLPTAGFDDMNGDEPIRDTFLSLGCTFEPLLLTDKSLTRAQIERAILSCDVVYAGGGNLQFLMDTWTRTGACDALRQAYDRGVVLSGFSSGAMCWFAGGYDDCGEEHSFVFLRCLGLLPHICCPHYTSEVWQRFGTRIRETGQSGIGIEDGAALVCRDGVYSVIAGNEGGDVFFYDKTDDWRKIRITDDTSILTGRTRP
jgi:dipeptidase E